MIFVENLIKSLKKNKINFFTGVPDSILKNFSSYLEKYPKKNILLLQTKERQPHLASGIIYLQKKFHVYIYRIQV